MQCLAGEPTAWAIHKQGLDKMIQSRGGIQNLDLEGAAPRTVSWFVAPLTTSLDFPLLDRILVTHLSSCNHLILQPNYPQG